MKKYLWATLVLVVAVISTVIGYQRCQKPLVSVVMLTYKRADIVPRAIDSILAQTFKDFEFIILNDGSPDNTDEVIEKYVKKDSRIRYYKNDQNRGISYSRNRAASLARGKYVAIMDDDDESLPERLQKQVEFMEKHPDVTTVATQIKGLPRVPLNHDDIATGLIQYNNFGNSNTMYKREFQKRNNVKYDPGLKASEDWKFWLQMLFSGAKFATLDEDLHIRHGDSIKHYGISYEEANAPIREYVAQFFSPSNPQAFYTASACDKLKMIAKAPTKIFSQSYLDSLLATNCF